MPAGVNVRRERNKRRLNTNSVILQASGTVLPEERTEGNGGHPAPTGGELWRNRVSKKPPSPGFLETGLEFVQFSLMQ